MPSPVPDDVPLFLFRLKTKSADYFAAKKQSLRYLWNKLMWLPPRRIKTGRNALNDLRLREYMLGPVTAVLFIAIVGLAFLLAHPYKTVAQPIMAGYIPRNRVVIPLTRTFSIKVVKVPPPKPKPVYVSIGPICEQVRRIFIQLGVPSAHLPYAMRVIQKESGCRVNARNPKSGAYGLPQALPGTKMASHGSDWRTNPVTQLRWANDYVKARYGTWKAASQFQDTKGWY